MPNYGLAGQGRLVHEGLCVAIEPMVNVGGPETRLLEDGWTVVTADGSRSAHFEHTVAVTSAGPIVLTVPASKGTETEERRPRRAEAAKRAVGGLTADAWKALS